MLSDPMGIFYIILFYLSAALKVMKMYNVLFP